MSQQQLDLFSTLPVLLRPPRRLRRLGFELDLLKKGIATLLDCRRELDQSEVALATAVAEAKAVGRMERDAYLAVVRFEDIRARLADKLRDADELSRALERQLAKGIEKHLAHYSEQRVDRW